MADLRAAQGALVGLVAGLETLLVDELHARGDGGLSPAAQKSRGRTAVRPVVPPQRSRCRSRERPAGPRLDGSPGPAFRAFDVCAIPACENLITMRRWLACWALLPPDPLTSQAGPVGTAAYSEGPVARHASRRLQHPVTRRWAPIQVRSTLPHKGDR